MKWNMRNKLEKVLVVFSDDGLGGTSRSALTSCDSWLSLGYDVAIYAAKGVAESRQASFESKGSMLGQLSDVCWGEIKVVHFHYSSYSAGQQAAIDELVESVSTFSGPSPILIVNNIFAIPDSAFNRWPGRWCTTVLGRWAAVQYELGSLRLGSIPFVVGNGQDTEFFRPPSMIERIEARLALGIDDNERVVLRIGSPHEGKWSQSYLALADACAEVGSTLILVGAPVSLQLALRDRASCRLVNHVDDDTHLRDFYWASDCFALDAQRGESFGNVILEALCTGLPVVYRAREFRDNTPWEFRSIQGFSYAGRKQAFIREVIDVHLVSSACGDRAFDVAHSSIIDRYSVSAVSRILGSIVNKIKSHPHDGKISGARDFNISVLQLGKVSVLHNPIISYLKQVRLKARGKWRF